MDEPVTTDLIHLNKIAQERFENIKKRLRIDTINIGIIKSNVPIKSIDKKLLEKVFNEQPIIVEVKVDNPEMQKIIDKELTLIDATFAFIDSLNLSPNLSLAVAQIISYNQTIVPTDLHKAIAAITKELEIVDAN